MTDTVEKRHSGITLVENEDSFEPVELEPHYRHECKEKCKEARERKTVYEDRAVVGYSRTYAKNYDAAFGRN